MRQAPRLTVAVINFQGEERLPPLLSALAPDRALIDELLVVDDASTDASLLVLRRAAIPLRVLAQAANSGPAAARQRALEEARGRFILFLDNDALPRPGAIGLLLEALEARPAAAAVMPRILFPGPPALVHCDGASGHPSGQLHLHHGHTPPRAAEEAPLRVSSLMSTAFLARREALLLAGGFAPEFGIYYEDHDLGTRLAAQGHELVAIPSAVVEHGSGTQGLSLRPGGRATTRRIHLQARNRILFVLRNFQGRTLRRLLPYLLVHELAQAVRAIGIGCGGSYATAWTWNLRHLGRTLRSRACVQAGRRLPDGALFVPGPLPLHPATLAGHPRASRWKERLDRVLARLLACARLGIEPRRERDGRPPDSGHGAA
jgi:GT2 family glycosyltransferase